MKIESIEQDKSLKVNRDCYNSYFYVVEDDMTTSLDKMIMHGQQYTKYLDGGSALHLNLERSPTKEAALLLFKAAATAGCNYWCTNVRMTLCNECDHIDKRTLTACPVCGSENIDYATRVIGYLKREKHFSGARQKEAAKRAYHKVAE